MIQKQKKTINYKIFKGTAYQLRMSEKKEDSLRNYHRRKVTKGREADADMFIQKFVQKTMRKHTDNLITGEVFMEDFEDIYRVLMRVLDNKED